MSPGSLHSWRSTAGGNRLVPWRPSPAVRIRAGAWFIAWVQFAISGCQAETIRYKVPSPQPLEGRKRRLYFASRQAMARLRRDDSRVATPHSRVPLLVIL